MFLTSTMQAYEQRVRPPTFVALASFFLNGCVAVIGIITIMIGWDKYCADQKGLSIHVWVMIAGWTHLVYGLYSWVLKGASLQYNSTWIFLLYIMCMVYAFFIVIWEIIGVVSIASYSKHCLTDEKTLGGIVILNFVAPIISGLSLYFNAKYYEPHQVQLLPG